MSTYAGRHQGIVSITRFEPYEKGDQGAVTTSAGWTVGVNPTVWEALKALPEGAEVIVETQGMTRVVGWRVGPEARWIWRKSDEDIAAEHAAFVAENLRKNTERYEKNKDGLHARINALRPEFKARFERILAEKPEWATESMGMEYELILFEMVEIRLKLDGWDGELAKFASEHGVSGFQYETAEAMAKAWHEGERNW